MIRDPSQYIVRRSVPPALTAAQEAWLPTASSAGDSVCTQIANGGLSSKVKGCLPRCQLRTAVEKISRNIWYWILPLTSPIFSGGEPSRNRKAGREEEEDDRSMKGSPTVLFSTVCFKTMIKRPVLLEMDCFHIVLVINKKGSEASLWLCFPKR